MLFSLTEKLLIVALSLGQVNGDAASDGSTDNAAVAAVASTQVAAVSENDAVTGKAEAEDSVEEEVSAPAREAIAQERGRRVANRDINDYNKVVAGKGSSGIDAMTAPGHLAYKRGGMVGAAIGMTIAGVMLAYPMLSLSGDMTSDSSALGMFIGGSVLLAAALGFGPSMGQLMALGKNSQLLIPIVRAASVLAAPLLTMYFMGVTSLHNNLDVGDYYNAYMIATICSASLAMVWGIVDIAMTPGIIKRYIRKYERAMGVSQLRAAPMALENGGGMMIGFRF